MFFTNSNLESRLFVLRKLITFSHLNYGTLFPFGLMFWMQQTTAAWVVQLCLLKRGLKSFPRRAAQCPECIFLNVSYFVHVTSLWLFSSHVWLHIGLKCSHRIKAFCWFTLYHNTTKKREKPNVHPIVSLFIGRLTLKIKNAEIYMDFFPFVADKWKFKDAVYLDMFRPLPCNLPSEKSRLTKDKLDCSSLRALQQVIIEFFFCQFHLYNTGLHNTSQL